MAEIFNFKEFYDANNEILRLPLQVDRAKDYLEELEEKLKKYIILIKNTDYLKCYYDFIEKTCKDIIEASKVASMGDYLKAHEVVNRIIKGYIDYEVDLIQDIESYFIDDEKKMWFRARESRKPLFSNEEMKNIPLSDRDKVANQRFSPNGIPCLYFANSIVCCWEELGRPHLEDFYVSHSVIQSCRLLNLSRTAFEIYLKLSYKSSTDYASIEKTLKDFFCIWPLQCACSAIIKDNNRIFKQEYVFPQLLMSLCRNFKAQGVLYFSSRMPFSFNESDSWISKCIAIPVYCDTIFDEIKCHISAPYNIGLLSQSIIGESTKKEFLFSNFARTHARLPNLNNTFYQYSTFYRCEIELVID